MKAFAGRSSCPNHGSGSSVFYVRAHTGSSAAYSLIRNEVRQLDAAMPVYAMKTLEGQLDETLMTDRLIAMLSAGFGLLATVLASIGLYGVMAFVVARRRKEIGIRMALGANPGNVIWSVMKEVLILLGIGLADRRPRRDRARSLRRLAALWHRGPRSVDGRDDRYRPRAGVGGRRPDSRPPRQPRQSGSGVEIRIGRGAEGATGAEVRRCDVVEAWCDRACSATLPRQPRTIGTSIAPIAPAAPVAPLRTSSASSHASHLSQWVGP